MALKRYSMWLSLAACFVLAASGRSPAQTATLDRKADGPATRPVVRHHNRIPYDAPLIDPPGKTMGGISRGAGSNDSPFVVVLAPKDGGITIKSRPRLYWYLSKMADERHSIVLAINRLGIPGQTAMPKTVFEVQIPQPAEAGIQCLDLAQPPAGEKNQLTLEPGVNYEWVVEFMIHDLHDKSLNPYSRCALRYQPPKQDLINALKGADASDLAIACGRQGVWFDALAALRDAIQSHPQDTQLQGDWEDFLAEGGIAVDHGRIIPPAQQ